MSFTNSVKSAAFRFVKKYLLSNFRRGFATNSSSSHSFVYLKKVPEDAYNHEVNFECIDNEYGWEDFRISSILEKLFYVMTSRIEGWEKMSEERKQEVRDEFPEFSDSEIALASDGYVDHQSIGTISAKEARDPYTVIFGGHDNDGWSNERAKVVSGGLVDWKRSDPHWSDTDVLGTDLKSPELAEMIQGLKDQGWSNKKIKYEINVDLGEDD